MANVLVGMRPVPDQPNVMLRPDGAGGRVVVLAFPTLVLAVAIVGIFGPSLTNAMIAIGIVYSPTFARIARGSTLSFLLPLVECGAARRASE